MFKFLSKIWEMYKIGAKERRVNHWSNWKRTANARYVKIHESDTTEYHEKQEECINIFTGDRRWYTMSNMRGNMFRMLDKKTGEVLASNP